MPEFKAPHAPSHLQMLKSCWQFRGFMASSISRQLQARYRGTLLGIAWIFMMPLLQIGIYTLIFSNLMQSRLPGTSSSYAYSIFLCAGILPWLWIADILSSGVHAFTSQANLIKKTHFPKITLLGIVGGVSSINFLIMLGLYALFLLIIQAFPGWILWHLIPLLALQLILVLSLALLLASIQVYFRDMAHLTQIALQLGFWLTPIAYPINALPSWVQELIRINPLTRIIEAQQQLWLNQTSPDYLSLWWPSLCALGLNLLAVRFYRHHEAWMAEEL